MFNPEIYLAALAAGDRISLLLTPGDYPLFAGNDKKLGG